jgi:DNA polymerase III alpha subunit
MSRTKMLEEYKTWESLRDGEKTWVRERSIDTGAGKPYTTLVDAIRDGAKVKKEGGACARKDRVPILQNIVATLQNPATSFEDSPNWLVGIEEQLLGIALTCSRVDGCDTSAVNCTCLDFLQGKQGFLILGVEVELVKVVKMKRGDKIGKEMAFLNIADNTASLNDVVVFNETWEEYKSLLTEGNTVLVEGERDKRKGSLIVKKIHQI